MREKNIDETGSSLRAGLIFCLLAAISTFVPARAVVDPEMLEQELRSQATEVVKIFAEKSAVARGPRINQVSVRARVLEVRSSRSGLTAGQVIEIRYTQDHRRAATEHDEQASKADRGWAGQQVIGYPRALRRGETVIAYLRAHSSGPNTYYPAAADASFIVAAARATSPCDAIEEIGPVTSLVRQCLQHRYAKTRARLERTAGQFARTLAPTTTGSDNPALREAEAKRLDFFRESQSSWEEFIDAACREMYYQYWPGSMAENARLECLLEFTGARIDYLERRMADVDG